MEPSTARSGEASGERDMRPGLGLLKLASNYNTPSYLLTLNADPPQGRKKKQSSTRSKDKPIDSEKWMGWKHFESKSLILSHINSPPVESMSVIRGKLLGTKQYLWHFLSLFLLLLKRRSQKEKYYFWKA